MEFSFEDINKILKKYFGFDSFRNGQDEIVRSVLEGNNTLVVMPTGGGKSLCYQLPALISEGVAIVISPLIALMKDQVDSLNRLGIPATFINSSLPYAEIQYRMEQAVRNVYKLIYIAPERLESRTFLDFLRNLNISFLTVDEAHCISEWGHDFRPSYLSIIKAIESIITPTVIALTATATPVVQADIIKSLKMTNVNKFIRGFDRPNLSYQTEKTSDKVSRIIEILDKTNEGSSIVYCGSRKRVEMFYNDLRSKNIDCLAYHGGMKPELRKSVQESFFSNKAKVIIATNAFGMGIDKPDVRNVIHCDYTQTLEAYYQEAGRAGRDNEPANCFLLYTLGDRNLQDFFIDSSFPSQDKVEKFYDYVFDLNSIGIGQKPIKPIYLNLTDIADNCSIPVNAAESILSLFERFGVMKRGALQGNATIKLIATRERIKEYYNNTTDLNRNVLEAILRTVSSAAFGRDEELDINNLVYKHNINLNELNSGLNSLEFARIIYYIPPSSPEGIIILKERTTTNSIPIDFENLNQRRERAIKKLDVVIRYSETPDCKRNFILNYFQESDIIDKCNICSSCLNIVKPRVIASRNKFLQNEILRAAFELDGKFGKALLADFVKGKMSVKIKQYDLNKLSTFSTCKEFNLIEIKEEIENLIYDNLISISPDIYPTVKANDYGKKLVNDIPKPFKFNNSIGLSNNNELYKKLANLREEIAMHQGVVPRAIISDISLRRIASLLPKNKEELAQISGTGSMFVHKWGDLFIQSIKETFAIEEKKNIKPAFSDVEEKIINMINSNFNLNMIADRLNISVGNAAKLIQDIIEKGYNLDKNRFCEEDTYQSVFKIVHKKPNAPLKKIRELINIDIEFSLLRVIVALARMEIKSHK